MSNSHWLIHSIPLDFETQHSLLLTCAHCQNPLLPLTALYAYLRLRHTPTLQLSAFFLAPIPNNSSDNLVNPTNSYLNSTFLSYLLIDPLQIAVSGPFLLCQVGTLRCKNCNKPIGHHLGKTTPEHLSMSHCFLFDLDKLHDSKANPGLKQSIQQQSQLALQTTAPSPRPTPSVLSVDSLQQTISKSMQNIGFFGARLTQIEMRMQKLGQICGMLQRGGEKAKGWGL